MNPMPPPGSPSMGGGLGRTMSNLGALGHAERDALRGWNDIPDMSNLKVSSIISTTRTSSLRFLCR